MRNKNANLNCFCRITWSYCRNEKKNRSLTKGEGLTFFVSKLDVYLDKFTYNLRIFDRIFQLIITICLLIVLQELFVF